MRDSSGRSSGPAEGRPVDALVPRPAQGRRYTHHRRVRVSDAGPEGALRLDSLARYLQDVATDDWADAGLSPDEIGVVRRTTVQVAGGGRWPALGEDVDLTTWCGGTGLGRTAHRPRSQRRAHHRNRRLVGTSTLGRPLRLGPEFHDVYGEAAGGRRASGRVPVAPSLTGMAGVTGRPWPIRRADLDIVGHVNNAAVWAAVTEVAGGPVVSAALTHHGPLENGHTVTLLTGPGRMCLMTDDEVRASAEWSLL